MGVESVEARTACERGWRNSGEDYCMESDDDVASVLTSTSKFESIEVDSVATFGSVTEKVCKEFGLKGATIDPWYRGQEHYGWPLKPSLYRPSTTVDPEFERELIRDFRIKCADFVSIRPQSEIDWLFLAQHHGVPTRLLDWTENPLVALYFATAEHQNADRQIWALNPWRMNSGSLEGKTTIPTTDSDDFKAYIVDVTTVNREVTAELPLAIRAFYSFRRSNAQSAVFTIHGRNTKGIDRMKRYKNKTFLLSLRVAASKKYSIRQELYRLGVHEWSLFQSLDALAKTLAFRYSKRFLS
jgi:FRG domain